MVKFPVLSDNRRLLRLCCMPMVALTVSASGISVTLDQNRLSVQAPDGAPVVIEQSEDLVMWSDLGSGIATDGYFLKEISGGGTRYFRAHAGATVIATNASPFVLTVNPELVTMPDGQIWRVAPQTVTVHPGTNYLAGDLFDGRLHVLKRRLHDGAVYYSRVIADTNGVTQVEPINAVLPITAIPKTKAAIAAHQALKVVLVGDSLEQGAGIADYHGTWPFLVFDATATTNAWSLRPEVSPLTYRNFGIGGITAEYGLIATRPGSPVLTTGYDLAIVGFGANPGTGDAVLVESMVHELRSAGIEVILQSGEQRQDGIATPFLDTDVFLAGIAANQGCALADTYSYMLENDGNYSTDKVHPSELGHQVWAGCMRSLLNGLPQESKAVVPASEFQSLTSLPESLRGAFPTSTTVQFTPTTTTGISAASLFPYNTMGVVLGKIPALSAVNVLVVGQSATFHADSACAVSLLTENPNGVQAEVLVEYGNGMPNRSLTVNGFFLPRITPSSGIGTWNTNLPVDLTITVTDGVLTLAGVSFPVRH